MPQTTRSAFAVPLLAAALAVGACGTPAQEDASGARSSIRPIEPPAGPGAMAPSLSSWGGSVLLSWLEPARESGQGSMSLRFARLGPGGWSEARTILTETDLFASWEDVPSIVEERDGDLVAAWIRKSGEGAVAHEVQLSRSSDGGRTWERIGSPHEDETLTEHGFVSLVPEGDGTRAFWLDGRETIPVAGGVVEGDMALRTGFIGDRPEPSELLDDRVCDCCETAAVRAPEGPVVAYRDRSPAEIRDISILRKTEEAWSVPAAVHADGWTIPGCPINGPALGSRDSEIVAAWHTSADDNPRVLVAFSENSGASFEDPIVVDANEPLGRVGVVSPAPGEAIVIWLAKEARRAVVRLARVGRSGKVGAAMDLTETDAGRASGFPRIALDGDDLIAVWSQPGNPASLKAARVPLDAVASLGEPPQASASPKSWNREVGSPAPEFSGKALDGREVSLSGLEGEAVLVNLWATWCEPCREEIPVLAGIARSHEAAGLHVLGVSLDVASLQDRVREMADTEKIPYTVVMDSEGEAADLFGVSALPASFLFDRRGNLVWKRIGPIREHDEDLARAIEKALSS